MKIELVMRDFAIVTFAVDPRRLESLLPSAFEPQTFALHDGGIVAFVSAVTFRNSAVRAGGVRIPLRYVQSNYRAYVWRSGKPCVWFFGSALSTPAAFVPEMLLGVPWHYGRLNLDVRWTGEACPHYEMNAQGPFGQAEFACRSDGLRVTHLDGFSDAAHGTAALTQLRSGFLRRRNGTILELRVEHEPLRPVAAATGKACFSVFHRLGLVAPGAPPHSVMLAKETVFQVLPPRCRRGEAPTPVRPSTR
jgi:uncharacterized protein YqjF (DUF2071 family)